MHKPFYSLLTLSILTALYSSSAAANPDHICLTGIPMFEGDAAESDPNNQPIYISADTLQAQNNESVRYMGDVKVQQGFRHLSTQQLELIQNGQDERAQHTVRASDGFSYRDNLITLNGTTAQLQLNSKDGDVEQANYQLVGRQGRGDAEQITLRETYRELKNATYTSCLPGDNAWLIKAKEIRQHIQKEYAEMWHARLHLAGVPIFYTPYLQLPIGDRRRSGLLTPDFGSSSRDGYWFTQPMYWNIAPNFDATFSPKYMSHRGWQLNGEMRYLTLLGEGKFAGEYLAQDRYDEYDSDNRRRHLFFWQHSSAFLQNWRLNVDYTRVSDRRYFSDFDSTYGSSSDGYADQTARISYYQPNYNISLSAKQFQVFDESSIGPYRALPQLDINYYRHGLWHNRADFKLFTQAVYFDNDSALMPTAWRYHFEPTLTVPLTSRYGSVNIETKLYSTYYQQKAGQRADAEKVQKTVTRNLPQLKVDFQTLLASQDNLFKNYTQTIEPRIQYLYRPYRDQSHIGSKLNSQYLGFGYDSSLLQQDYFALFRDRRYSGLDRIASANQITLGGTTRFYDKYANERFNLSLGQIVYLNDSKIDSSSANATTGRASSWSLESNWLITPKWQWRASYQYDTRLDATSLANMVLEYNPSGDNLVQLSYRYASKEYIDQNLSESAKSYNQDIKQLGLTFAWEVNNNWSVVGRYYQDLALKKPIEQYLGVQYSSCCWAVQIGGRRFVTSRTNQSANEVLYDRGIHLNFKLRGVGQNDHSNGIQKMLDAGVLNYLHPFSL